MATGAPTPGSGLSTTAHVRTVGSWAAARVAVPAEGCEDGHASTAATTATRIASPASAKHNGRSRGIRSEVAR